MWAALPRRGAVAQMGERCNRTAEVRGSIPLSSTSPAVDNSITHAPTNAGSAALVSHWYRNIRGVEAGSSLITGGTSVSIRYRKRY